mmetsp:Transcript_12770/g.38020  ORF Transcript_12770/g.38020 Transcript_12770/m.38020 type:complete len:221 (-) Transcript_12770:453-1115(-)
MMCGWCMFVRMSISLRSASSIAAADGSASPVSERERELEKGAEGVVSPSPVPPPPSPRESERATGAAPSLRRPWSENARRAAPMSPEPACIGVASGASSGAGVASERETVFTAHSSPRARCRHLLTVPYAPLPKISPISYTDSTGAVIRCVPRRLGRILRPIKESRMAVVERSSGRTISPSPPAMMVSPSESHSSSNEHASNGPTQAWIPVPAASHASIA